MLAYVFWHWRSSQVDPAAYERELRAFHASLAAAPPSGFRGSVVLRLQRAPWIEGDAGGFADWYLVDGWSTLGELNEAAVSGATKAPHDRVAHASAGGAGAIYGLRSGAPSLPEARSVAFCHKPPNTGYEDFYGQLAGVADPARVSVWRRQMELGPAPEFCLFGADPLELPASLDPIVARVELAWPLGGAPEES